MATINKPSKAKIVPVVGMGATLQVGSDSYPYTIIEVSSDYKLIKIQQDDTAPIKEAFDYYTNQKYDYTPNANAVIDEYTLGKDGRYHKKGESINSPTLFIGNRRYYSDPHF